MSESRFITQHIVAGFGQLNHLGILEIEKNRDLNLMILKAIDFLDNEIKRDFERLKELNPKQEEALNKIKTNVLEKYEFGTGVQEILNRAVFEILGYLAIFPASANKLGDSKGNILPDCFLLPKDSTALDFAYFLHIYEVTRSGSDPIWI